MAYYSSYRPARPRPKRSRRRWLITSLIVLVAVIIGALWLTRQKSSAPAETTAISQPEPTVTPTEQQRLPNLQPVVDQWVATHPGTYAVKITDTSGQSLAEIKGNQPFFTASIYKLYVAYIGYQAVDRGTYQLSDPYLSGYTRGKCLDAMIRDSYSPCGEKMWAELGKDNLTQKLKSYGLTGTSMTGLQTTANDAAIILANIATGKDLSPASQAAYLDSMKTQDDKYRRGLPSGIKDATVYNKVGWNLDQEWHDTAIVELPNGQKIIVSVFTDGVGFSNVAGLGTALQKALQ